MCVENTSTKIKVKTGGKFDAGFYKTLTSNEFRNILLKLHQVRGDHPRHPRQCNRRTIRQLGTVSDLFSKLPLSQPCWHLNFVGCSRLGDDAMLHLPLIPSTVIDLDFSDCNLTSVGIGRLCEFLKRPESNVKRLILWGNRIGDDGAIFLSEMLKVNTTLQILHIHRNDQEEDYGEFAITRRGWAALGRALAINNTLQEFDFANLNFENKDLLALGAGLRYNTSLHTLNLSLSSVTDLGIRLYVQKILKKNKTFKNIILPSWLYGDDPVSLETYQEVTYALERNRLFRQQEEEQDTNEDWMSLLTKTSSYENPTCTFWLLRDHRPELCNFASLPV